MLMGSAPYIQFPVLGERLLGCGCPVTGRKEGQKDETTTGSGKSESRHPAPIDYLAYMDIEY